MTDPTTNENTSTDPFKELSTVSVDKEYKPFMDFDENGLTDPEKIDWDTVDVAKDINWNGIDFLEIIKRKGKHVIARHPSVRQCGGLVPILAYQKNLLRVLERCEGGDAFIEEINKRGLLFDMAMTLARGFDLPIE